jgi:hypothetical protein
MFGYGHKLLNCSFMIINNIRANANYIVVLDHEGGKGYLQLRNKVAVFYGKGYDFTVK